MTEAEWLAYGSPGPLLSFLSERASDRKLRLLACACGRRLFHLLAAGPLQEGFDAAEAYVDGACTRSEYRGAAVRAAHALTPYHGLGVRAAEQITDWQPGGWEPGHATWHG